MAQVVMLTYQLYCFGRPGPMIVPVDSAIGCVHPLAEFRHRVCIHDSPVLQIVGIGDREVLVPVSSAHCVPSIGDFDNARISPCQRDHWLQGCCGAARQVLSTGLCHRVSSGSDDNARESKREGPASATVLIHRSMVER